jgi:hypothetical protein
VCGWNHGERGEQIGATPLRAAAPKLPSSTAGLRDYENPKNVCTTVRRGQGLTVTRDGGRCVIARQQRWRTPLRRPAYGAALFILGDASIDDPPGGTSAGAPPAA